MTRKDYIEIADKLAWALAYADGCQSADERACAHGAVGVAIHGIADVLAADNPRFDRARFIGAATTVVTS